MTSSRNLTDTFSQNHQLDTGHTVSEASNTGSMTDTGKIIEESLNPEVQTENVESDLTTEESEVYGLAAADSSAHQKYQGFGSRSQLNRLSRFEEEETQTEQQASETAEETIMAFNSFEGMKYGNDSK